MTTTARRQWNDETIRQELLPVADELGRMPTRKELTDRGVGGAWAAMGRLGGVDAWRELVAQHLTSAAPVEAPAAVTTTVEVVNEGPVTIVETTSTATIVEAPTEEHVRIAAYFLFQNGHPGGAEAHWQIAERELNDPAA
jgi:hypothetical protein